MKVLFVCLGNICRSPTAESVFRDRAEKLGLKNFVFDSAGTSANHVGENSDSRSIFYAEKRGYSMTHLGRQIEKNDYENFDLILTMDESNFSNVIQKCPSVYNEKIKKVTDFCLHQKYTFVPDPYYGGEAGFQLVLDILEDAANGFFAQYSKSK